MASQPLVPLTPENLKKMGRDPLKGAQRHMHEIRFALTKGNRLVRLKGGRQDEGSSVLWMKDEEYAIEYNRLPERNRAAYLVAKFLGLTNIMPVTVLVTERSGDRYINLTAQEWVWGDMVYNLEATSMEQYVDAWVFEYIIYNRDRNIRGKMVRASDRQLIIPDQDYSFAGPAEGDNVAFPPEPLSEREKNLPSEREKTPPYGEALSDALAHRLRNLNMTELDDLERQIRAEGLLNDGEIKALRNHIVLMAKLVRLSGNGTIPKLPSGADYLGEARTYNPSEEHFKEIKSALESKRKVAV